MPTRHRARNSEGVEELILKGERTKLVYKQFDNDHEMKHCKIERQYCPICYWMKANKV